MKRRPKLDPATQDAVLGHRHKDRVVNARKYVCNGCGMEVYLTAGCFEEASERAKQAGYGIVVVCDQCVEPFLQRVALGESELAGDRDVVEGMIPDLQRRRDDFIGRN